MTLILLNCLSLERGQEKHKDFIINSLYGFDSEIDVKRFGIHKDELSAVVTDILKDNPYLFFVEPTMGYEADSSGVIWHLYPSYNMERAQFNDAKAFCDIQIRGVLTLLSGVEDNYEKALMLHDYLCVNFSYDESYISDDMYSFFASGRGTCQGYTFAYMALLREAGIYATYAASDEMEHIWTLAEMDGEWFHVDVTWDDGKGYEFSHDNFLRNDEGIKSTRHKGWYSHGDIVSSGDERIWNGVSPLSQFAGTGDVNCDGRVDVADIVMCKVRDERNFDNAVFLKSAHDINGDNELTNEDVLLLKKFVLD